MVAPVDGDRKPVRFLKTPFNESTGQFSADGKWLAYMSDESGGYQVYVQPIRPDGRRWHISTAGGTQPRWSRDGKTRTLMAVPITIGTSFEQGTAHALFEGVPTTNFLLMLQAEARTRGSPPITIVTNWLAG